MAAKKKKNDIIKLIIPRDELQFTPRLKLKAKRKKKAKKAASKTRARK